MGNLTVDELQSQLLVLRDELGVLRSEVTRLNDIQAIRTLHFKYGYYWDNVLYEQVIDIFTDDVKVWSSSNLTDPSSSIIVVVCIMERKEHRGYIRETTRKTALPMAS